MIPLAPNLALALILLLLCRLSPPRHTRFPMIDNPKETPYKCATLKERNLCKAFNSASSITRS